MDFKNFADKTAIITGGSRGIGRSIALELARLGANISIVYAGNEGAVTETKTLLGKIGADEGAVIFVKADISDAKAAEKAVSDTVETFGGVDILVNNAGITRDGLLLRMSEADFDDVLAVNLKGAFNMLKAVTKPMIKRRGGSIISLSSVVGIRGNAGQANYAASKAGVIGLTLSAAKELGSRNIRVNAIAPGLIATDMTDALSDEQKEAIKSNVSLGRIGKPEEVAKLVAFLASDAASYITGEVITIDGGMRI